MNTQMQSTVTRFSLTATLLSAALFTPTIAFAAAPPATEATCSGIKNAYPIIGRKCESNYSKIEHSLDTPQKRLTTFKARVAVLEIFRKALLCNGMYGANSSIQDKFKSGEKGHLQAVAQLHTAMTNEKDTNIPNEYVASNLTSISIRKEQCN